MSRHTRTMTTSRDVKEGVNQANNAWMPPSPVGANPTPSPHHLIGVEDGAQAGWGGGSEVDMGSCKPNSRLDLLEGFDSLPPLLDAPTTQGAP
jgi:hypothetical protein